VGLSFCVGFVLGIATVDAILGALFGLVAAWHGGQVRLQFSGLADIVL
jgi:ABC-type dipeptide/oligopeptide/nickel transport system permease subunit